MSRLRLGYGIRLPIFSVFAFSLLEALVPRVAVAYDALVIWLPVIGASGYKIYSRRTGESYTTGTDVGARLADTDGLIRVLKVGLTPGVTNFVAVTSYNAARVESTFSNEISVFVSSTPTPTRTLPPPTATATRTSPIPGATATPTRTATLAGATPTRTLAPATATFTPTRTVTAVSSPTRTLTFTPTRTGAPSGRQYCGNTTQANGNPTGGWNHTVDGVPCTSGSNAGGYRVASCRIYAEVASGNVRCGLYDNRADPNKALLCESASVPAVAGWNTLPLTSCPTLPANAPLWVAMNTDSFDFRPGLTTGTCNQSPGASYYRFVTYGALPNPWGSRTSDTCALSVHVELDPIVGGATATATRTNTQPPITFTPSRTPTRTFTANATPTRASASPTPTPTATPTPVTQVCGNTAQANGNPTGGWNDTVDGIPCTTGNNVGGYQITSCRIYAEVASGNIRCGVYNNRRDPRKALLCESASVAAVPGWNTLPLPSCPTVKANTPIWVAMNADSINFRPGLTTGSCNQSTGANYYRFASYGPLPHPWGSRTADTCALSMHVLLNPRRD